MKRILTICLCLMMVVLMPSGIKAEEAVIIDETTFKDPLFRDYVVNNFDINKDGYLEDDEIIGAVKISIGNVAVSDLSGIEYLKELRSLELYGTKIADLDLSANTKLEELYLTGNSFETLTLSSYPNLKDLALQSVKINDIDLSKFPSLENLVIMDDKSINKLDVSANSKLRSMMIDGCSIETLDLSAQSSLVSIHLTNLGLKELKIGTNENLSYVSLSGNPSLSEFDATEFKDLNSLDISNTAISYLDPSNCPSLEYLNARNSALIGIDTLNNKALRYLDTRGCPLAYLNVGNIKNLYYDQTTTPEIIVYGKEYPYQKVLKDLDLSKVKELKGIAIEDDSFKDYKIGSNAVTYKYYVSDNAYINVNLKVMAYKGESVIEVDPLSKVYDGKVFVPNIKVNGSTSKPAYTIEGNGIDAGSYLLKVSVDGDDYYNGATKEFKIEIKKAIPDLYIKRGISKKYDGKKVDNIQTITDSDGKVTYTFEMLTKDGWQSIADAPSDAGIYRVSAHLAEGTNYLSAVSLPHTFMIARDLSHLSLDLDLDKTYDGQKISVTQDMIDYDENDTLVIEWFKKDKGRYVLMKDEPLDVGEYQLVVFRLEDRNHYGTIASKTFFISKAKNEWLTDLKVEDAKKGEALKIKLPEAMFGKVYLEYAAKPEGPYSLDIPSEEGTYYVRAVVDESDNYFGLTSKAMEFKILGEETLPDHNDPIIIPETGIGNGGHLLYVLGSMALAGGIIIYIKNRKHS